MKIPVARRILAENESLAADLRERFDQAGVLVVNIMGSPGAGKTSLVEKTVEHTAGRTRIGVIEGDLATSLDADRIARAGAPAVQVNTGGACHLDAAMVGRALDQLDLSKLDLLLIENVGNLVCPVQFDLGESIRVLVCSLPEGDDKPAKYPPAFSTAHAVVLNKIDLLPHVPFDTARFEASLSAVHPCTPLFKLSCTTGDGLDAWLAWLGGKL